MKKILKKRIEIYERQIGSMQDDLIDMEEGELKEELSAKVRELWYKEEECIELLRELCRKGM